MRHTGFSTGCLHGSGMSMEEIVELYLSAGADAIELSFATPQEMEDFQLSDNLSGKINKFDYVTVHAPWKRNYHFHDEEARMVVDKIGEISAKADIRGVVVHPDPLPPLNILMESGIPFLIENMDHMKYFGTEPKHFRQFKRYYNLDFVFDIQHAYEHDPSMKLAEELMICIGPRLKHMHASGQAGGLNHSLIHAAENRDAITGILQKAAGLGIEKPVIIEGVMSGSRENFYNSARKEMELVKEYYRK
ncbi:MAG: hypothetical protein R6U32_04205 [Candidatus Woesearchaeota archaeon]